MFNELHGIAGLGGGALFGAHEFRSFIFDDRRRWFMNQYGRQSFDRIGFYGFPQELRERFLAAGYLLVPGVVDDSLFVVEVGGASLLELLTEVEPGLISALLADWGSRSRWVAHEWLASNVVALSARYFLTMAVGLYLSGGG